jgi:hypothetical protein
MNSTHDEIRSVPTVVVVVLLGVVAGLVGLLLGLLTLGVQATVSPDHVPLAVGPADPAAAAAVSPLAERLSSQGGGAVAWRTVGSRSEAESLLDEKQVYGAVLLSPGQGGLVATVLLSGAVNPSATQVAQPLLLQVAGRVASRVDVVTIHPASVAGRILPLAAGILLWLTALVASALVVIAGPHLRQGRAAGAWTRLGGAVSGALAGTAVVLGLAHAWDASIPLGWDVAGFLVLVGLAFALLQAAVLRLVGLPGLGLLALLYLMSPTVAGTVPELLNPVYRALLWSWTPFRFSAEGLRSLLFLGGGAPDVQPALWLFGAIALGGLALLLVPGRRRRLDIITA